MPSHGGGEELALVLVNALAAPLDAGTIDGPRKRPTSCAQTCATAQWSQAEEDEPQVRDSHIASTGSALTAIGIGALPCGLWYLPLHHCNYWRAAGPLGQTLSRGVPLRTPQNRAMAQWQDEDARESVLEPKWLLGTWYLVPGTWYLVPGTCYLVPGT